MQGATKLALTSESLEEVNHTLRSEPHLAEGRVRQELLHRQLCTATTHGIQINIKYYEGCERMYGLAAAQVGSCISVLQCAIRSH